MANSFTAGIKLPLLLVTSYPSTKSPKVPLSATLNPTQETKERSPDAPEPVPSSSVTPTTTARPESSFLLVPERHMVSCTMRYQLRLVLLLILCVIGNSDTEKDKEECTQSLIGLATCLPYVGGNAPAPTPDCCTGLKQVLKDSKKCLCLLIKDRNDPDLGLQLNVTLALTLPSVCKAPANISECPALLHLPANSPDAQVFYQIANNSSSIAGSPLAHSPIPSVGSSPTGAPAGAPKSAGCHIGKRYFGLEAIVGVVLLWSLTSNFFIG